MGTGEQLEQLFGLLLGAFGSQGWWPAEDDFEMVVGAILTQNTAWTNVERALGRLRVEGLLSVSGLELVPEERLAECIRPSGYFNGKARKLKAFLRHLRLQHDGDLSRLFHVKLPQLREELLGIWGIGPETADSIILYGARQPVFVVDAYTRRVFSRLGLSSPEAAYDELQRLFMENLPLSVPLFQEYHALIVALGKEICRPSPRCDLCPLRDLCATGRGGGTTPEAQHASKTRISSGAAGKQLPSRESGSAGASWIA